MANIANPFDTNEVVGIAPADASLEIKTALEVAGFAIESLDGPQDADSIEVDGDGFGSSVLRFFQQGEEQEALREYRQRLERGDSVIRVLEVDDRAEEAGRIFVDHGGETIWHYGKWTYKKLHS